MYKHQYSQNFINNKAVVRKLIELSNITQYDTVIEIDTGKGIITGDLCKTSKKVISVEKDENLYYMAKKKLSGYDNLQLINGDFLDYSLPTVSFKCLSNIPFSITAEIIRKLLFRSKQLQSAYLIMQKEAAIRFLGLRNHNQISTLLYPIFNGRIIKKIKSTYFSPIPKVEVVYTEFSKRKKTLVGEYDLYKEFIAFMFNQWSKTIKYPLKKVFSWTQIKKFSNDYGMDIDLKPSEVEFLQYIKIFNFIESHRSQIKLEIFSNVYNQR